MQQQEQHQEQQQEQRKSPQLQQPKPAKPAKPLGDAQAAVPATGAKRPSENASHISQQPPKRPKDASGGGTAPKPPTAADKPAADKVAAAAGGGTASKAGAGASQALALLATATRPQDSATPPVPGREGAGLVDCYAEGALAAAAAASGSHGDSSACSGGDGVGGAGHCRLNLKKLRSFRELWGALRDQLPKHLLPDRLHARIVYLDASGDWVMVGPDDRWGPFAAAATKLMVCNRG